MKARVFVSTFVCVVSMLVCNALAFEPAVVPANPKLEKLSKDFAKKVYKVTEGVYVAVGYARSNPVLIEGTDGLIVIDPAESVNAAEIVKAAFNKQLDDIFSKKPVKAIIYTHYHDCHIHGASVFAGKGTPEIIAHESLTRNLYSPPGAVYSLIFPIKAYRAIKYMGIKFQQDPGYFVNGGLFPFSIPGPSGFLPPTKTVGDKQEITIAGVDLVLMHMPGETSDIIVVWLPKKKVLVQIGDFYKSFPALTTLRGASFRNPLVYIKSIDKMRSLHAEYLVLIHGGKPLVGAETINRALTNFRDGIQFIHDQTVQNMNKGLVPGEIIEIVKLPPHLADDPYLQEYFGQIDRDIYQIFLQYMGWYTGKARDIFPVSLAEEARDMAELAGGVKQLAAKAGEALKNGKRRWAMKLADDVLILNPGNAEARKVKNSAILSLAEETGNAQTRNYLLSEYLEDTGQVNFPIPAFSRIDNNLVAPMPMNTVFEIMAVRLDASDSLDKDIVVGLHLTDLTDTEEPADYTMHLRRGILEVQPRIADNPAFTITSESLAWKKLVLGSLDPEKAVSDGDIKVEGADAKNLYGFFGHFK